MKKRRGGIYVRIELHGVTKEFKLPIECELGGSSFYREVANQLNTVQGSVLELADRWVGEAKGAKE